MARDAASSAAAHPTSRGSPQGSIAWQASTRRSRVSYICMLRMLGQRLGLLRNRATSALPLALQALAARLRLSSSHA
jgi:hypothetical protein